MDALPGVLAELCEGWSLRLGRALPGGSASYLTAVVRADGTDAVLKVALPEVDVAAHAAVLRVADGRGQVRVLEVEPAHGALLLERLGRSLAQSGLGVEEQLDALAGTLRRVWLAPDPPALDATPDAASGTGRSLVDRIRAFDAQVPGALSPAVLEHARSLAEEVSAPGPDDLVLAHGDPHPGNLLRVRAPRPGAETGWCFVDPDPVVADRAHDLGVTVRDFSATLLADPEDAAGRLWSWCRRVAEPSGVDPRRVWAWGLLERVSTGLYVTSFGAPRVGAPFLRSAALLVAQRRPF